MATILMTWELGGGLGHVTVLRPIADALAARGHRIVLATRDVKAAERVFSGSPATFIQAPIKLSPVRRPFRPQLSYAHLLHHAGFESADELTALVHAWQGLFEIVRPQVVLFDHSPTALLASRGWELKRVLVGTGFCAPPVSSQLPRLRPWLPRQVDATCDELRTLATANEVLHSNDQPTLQKMSELYSETDENLLMTFEELDHFGPRSGETYWGTHAQCPGVMPEWPSGRGKRVFAYLKKGSGLPDTLRTLGESGQPSIVFGNWVTGDVRRRFPFGNLRFVAAPLDLTAVTASCDCAVLNATHGATAEFLLAGKPILQLPIYLEQRLVAERAAALGAACVANRRDAQDIQSKFAILNREERYGAAARRFSRRYSSTDRMSVFQQLIDRVDCLVA